jgi:endonuclease/exonuclease/phosphatase family metal-dependent hydrolase
MTLRVLTWNLKHGRAVPPAGRQLFDEFSALIAGWTWDVALLQEVPPWWPRPLAVRASADERLVLTSRNSMLALRRAVAVRWPDLLKSNGGGANAILVRGSNIVEHRVCRLGWWRERRWMHAVHLADDVWVGNLHTNSDARQGARAAEALRGWARDAPAILGGDFNVRQPALPGLARAGGHGVDQVYVTPQFARAKTEVLGHGHLSDHAPVLVTLPLRAPRADRTP